MPHCVALRQRDREYTGGWTPNSIAYWTRWRISGCEKYEIRIFSCQFGMYVFPCIPGLSTVIYSNCITQRIESWWSKFRCCKFDWWISLLKLWIGMLSAWWNLAVKLSSTQTLEQDGLFDSTDPTHRYSYITLDTLYFNAVAYENSIPCFTHWIIQKMYGSGIFSNSNI
jgi:hypothetical protein